MSQLDSAQQPDSAPIATTAAPASFAPHFSPETRPESASRVNRHKPASGLGALFEPFAGGTDATPALANSEASPATGTTATRRRRSVFSASASRLGHIRVVSAQNAADAHLRRSMRSYRQQNSLGLLDELMGNSVDPLYDDAEVLRAAGGAASRPSVVLRKTIVVILCICLGAGSVFAVRELQLDSRKKVRQALASQLSEEVSKEQKLQKSIDDLEAQTDAASRRLQAVQSPQELEYAQVNGTVSVSGSGIRLSLADPADDGDSASARVTAGLRSSVVTDGDLQQLVSLLWSAGAEAIAVNGHRLGPETSVRAAGETILVGVTPISPPYSLEAIGNQQRLFDALDSGDGQSLLTQMNRIGISTDVVRVPSMELAAASNSTQTTYAQKEGK